jgi:outer membrane protein OmpA-like peptidoglycan-associated protein
VLTTLALIACGILYHITAKDETNFQKLQLSPAEFPEVYTLKAHFLKVQTPSVKFPHNTYPERKLPEITSSQIRVQENEYLAIITLPADILFDSNKDMIRPDAEKMLRQVSQAINNHYPNTWLQILGHTDSSGKEDNNLVLSEQWVAAVQRWLSEKGGIDISFISKEGYGEAQPIAPNKKSDSSDNPAGRQRNRRIEIVIQKLVNNQV